MQNLAIKFVDSQSKRLLRDRIVYLMPHLTEEIEFPPVACIHRHYLSHILIIARINYSLNVPSYLEVGT